MQQPPKKTAAAAGGGAKGKTDGLFSWIEEREAAQPQPWGRVLDAGTGRHSLAWLLGLAARAPGSVTVVAAVTGERSLADALSKEFAGHAAGVPLRVHAGNWVDDAFLCEEEATKFDVVIADYLVGAIEGFAPFFQDAIIERIARHLAPGGRLYLVGLQPLSECAATSPDNADDVALAALAQEMARVRDACILLAGRRCYREFPMTWCERQLRVAGFRVDGSVRLANVYKRETVQRQLQVGRNQFVWFDDAVAQDAMRRKLEALETRAAALFDGGKKIRFGFDYVLAATKSG
ncbi:hypothetical protein PybrP1_009049 [[Pythium] brassicae (nom. inval.)]|nr:hypothetical protein PybrP1_009049 [[Pythium] brassicae (nom. inval.)]